MGNQFPSIQIHLKPLKLARSTIARLLVLTVIGEEIENAIGNYTLIMNGGTAKVLFCYIVLLDFLSLVFSLIRCHNGKGEDITRFKFR